MRYLYFIFLLTLMSCGVTKNTYMCGDRECIDKKEFKEYFAENLIMEIKKERKKENLKIDLVSINTNEINEDKSKKTSKKQNYRSQKKEEKTIFRAEKKRLKNERKKRKIVEKNKTKEEQKLVKLSKKKNKKAFNTLEKIIDPKKKINKNELFSQIDLKNQSNSCSKIKDCNIDEISELLIKKGREKNFPDITSK